MNHLLKLDEVTKVYGSYTALNQVSMSVPEGSVFGLLGPNGAGKTSMLRIVNQITAPDSGSVFFNGEKLKPAHKVLIGYLPEERGLYKKMEVGEQALYLAQLKGLSRSEALTRLKIWFERMEIKGWWRKKVEELSKGMQQKVQFIVTVIHEPQLLILDEPFTGFDPINAELIKEELLRLKANGTTILLSTHRMESIESLCSHIGLIHQSRKILEGSVQEIKHRFKEDVFEVEFAGDPIKLSESLKDKVDFLNINSIPGGSIADIRIGRNFGSNAFLQMALPIVTIVGFREKLPSMNEIFIRSVQDNAKEKANA